MLYKPLTHLNRRSRPLDSAQGDRFRFVAVGCGAASGKREAGSGKREAGSVGLGFGASTALSMTFASTALSMTFASTALSMTFASTSLSMTGLGIYPFRPPMLFIV